MKPEAQFFVKVATHSGGERRDFHCGPRRNVV
jgi:hypothetical protein